MIQINSTFCHHKSNYSILKLSIPQDKKVVVSVHTLISMHRGGVCVGWQRTGYVRLGRHRAQPLQMSITLSQRHAGKRIKRCCVKFQLQVCSAGYFNCLCKPGGPQLTPKNMEYCHEQLYFDLIYMQTNWLMINHISEPHSAVHSLQNIISKIFYTFRLMCFRNLHNKQSRDWNKSFLLVSVLF